MYRYRIYRCGLCLLCDVRARVKPSNTTSQCVRVGDSRLCVRLHDVRVFAQCAIVFAHEYNVIWKIGDVIIREKKKIIISDNNNIWVFFLSAFCSRLSCIAYVYTFDTTHRHPTCGLVILKSVIYEETEHDEDGKKGSERWWARVKLTKWKFTYEEFLFILARWFFSPNTKWDAYEGWMNEAW